jgi:hypothetical protein
VGLLGQRSTRKNNNIKKRESIIYELDKNNFTKPAHTSMTKNAECSLLFINEEINRKTRDKNKIPPKKTPKSIKNSKKTL